MKPLMQFDIRKQERNLVLVFIFAIILYTGFVLFADIHKIVAASFKFNWFIVPLVLILTFFNYIFRHLRFYYLLKQIGIHLSYKETFRIFMSGISMTVTPGKMGEVLKAYLIKEKTNNTYSQLVPLLIFERVFDGIAMIIMALGGVFFFRESLIFFIFASLMVIGFFVFISSKKYVMMFIKWFEGRFFHIKLLDFALEFFEHSSKLLSLKNIFMSTFLGIIAWTFEGISLYLLVTSFTHVQSLKDFFYSMFIFSFSSIAGFLVLIPGGVGVAEGSISSFLVLFFHLSLSQAIFITLLFRFSTLWFGVGLGLLFLIHSLKEMKK